MARKSYKGLEKICAVFFYKGTLVNGDRVPIDPGGVLSGTRIPKKPRGYPKLKPRKSLEGTQIPGHLKWHLVTKDIPHLQKSNGGQI